MLSKNIYDVLIEPIYSEKASVVSELNKHTFKVAKNATKQTIKEAVQKLFEVEVESVNVVNSKPKTKVFKGRIGKRSGFKKAVVTLKEGQMLEFTKGAK